MKPITSMLHVARESSKRATPKYLHWGLASLVLVCSGSAGAQVTGPITYGPDVAVAPNIMPTSVPAYQARALTYAVTASPPPLTIPGSSGSTNVKVHVDLTGLEPFSAEAVVAGGSCVYSTVNSVTGYATVDCTAPVSWGSTLFVNVYFMPMSTSASTTATCTNSFHCGQPVYADAYVTAVGPTAPDPNRANNRLLTRIVVTGC